ncbi:MAG: hypothetical protein KY468_21455 [Armatimonadetes bacterium]|nr:hypothetical protein [Armatimonadota bacterium]
MAPPVSFTLEDEPEFLPGEDYILCLREVDGLAYNEGPDHWRTTGGIFGVFQILVDYVKRKSIDQAPAMSKSMNCAPKVGHEIAVSY